MIWNIIAVVFCTPIGIHIYRGGNKKLGLLNIGLGVLSALAIVAQLL